MIGHLSEFSCETNTVLRLFPTPGSTTITSESALLGLAIGCIITTDILITF